jgi:hypothetical protein
MREEGLGPGGFHPVHRVMKRAALIEGREGPELDPAAQGGLPDEQAREGAVRIELGVSQLLGLVDREQVRPRRGR